MLSRGALGILCATVLATGNAFGWSLLDEVLQHYSEPGFGIGHLELAPMRFAEDELRQLAAFLGTLTSQVEDRQWLAPPQAEEDLRSPRRP